MIVRFVYTSLFKCSLHNINYASLVGNGTTGVTNATGYLFVGYLFVGMKSRVL
jgi:hypothetical protein